MSETVRSFETGFSPGTADSLVVGAYFFSALMVFAGLVRGAPIMFPIAILPALVGTYHYPMVKKDLPQLRADQDGLFVDGLGTLAWADIRTVLFRESYVRMMSNAVVVVETRGTYRRLARRPRSPMPLRSFFAGILVREAPNRFRLRLQGLNDKPEHIREAIEFFHEQSRSI